MIMVFKDFKSCHTEEEVDLLFIAQKFKFRTNKSKLQGNRFMLHIKKDVL